MRPADSNMPDEVTVDFQEAVSLVCQSLPEAAALLRLAIPFRTRRILCWSAVG
jgi:hypothetical protein